MKLIVDIPEDVYTRLFDNGIQDNEIAIDDVCEMARAIRLGIPLSKGHGRLIILSEDAIKREQTFLGYSCQSWISEIGLSNATVATIEADNSNGNTWYDIPADEMSESQLRAAVKDLRKKLAEVMNGENSD